MSSTAQLRSEAEFRCASGDFKGALERYLRLLELQPDDPRVLNDLGTVLFRLGLFAESEKCYVAALKIDPEYRDAMSNLRTLRLAAYKAEETSVRQSTGPPARAAMLGAKTEPDPTPAPWEPVRTLALKLISKGLTREAFRLVTGFRTLYPSEESGEFLRENFRDTPLRFCIAMVQGIGNMVMLTPAIRAIKQLYPRSELEVVGKLPALDVLAGWSLVDRCTELNAYDPSREHDAFLLSMWSGEFQKMWADHLTPSCVPLVVATYEDHRRHESECHLDLARMVGFRGEMPETYCATESIPLPFAEGERAALLADTSNPDPQWKRKRWPHFRELARRLHESGYQVCYIGGQAEAEEFDPSRWPEETLNLAGQYTIPQTAYLIEKAGLIVANDSGAAHMAAAVGAETYVLFGPTAEEKNLPAGRAVHMIAGEIGCRPCQYLPSWNDCTAYRCMESISVDQVMRAVIGRAEPADLAEPTPRPRATVAETEEVRVDLGCGHFKRKGFIGIDIDPESGADIVCDITQGIPLETDSVDCLAADNLLEHIGDEFADVMGEIWRVCKPGGKVEITVPLFPAKKAISDPTHRRHFTEDTFLYFDAREPLWESFGASYGFKPFKIISQRKLGGDLEVVLTPAKDVRLPHVDPQDGDRPRVCFISHNQPGAGGGENAVHHVANGLADNGYEITVFYNARPFVHALPVKAPADARYKLRWVEGPDLDSFHRAVSQAVDQCATTIDVCVPLWRANCRELIEVCNRRGIVAGMWCQNVNYPPDRSNASVFRQSEFIVAVTPYARLILEQRFGRTENVFVIPNAADDAFFANYRERTTQGVNRLVFFGRLSNEQKGLLTLCHALNLVKAEWPELSMDIIGDGPDRDLLRSCLGSLGLGENSRLRGWKSSEELAALLPDYDLCVLPSNFEACSLAVTEAMAAGVPLVTTAVGGTHWLIQDRMHGLLVPPQDPGALAEAIKWARKHPEEMNVMARWAHKKALKRFHWERVVRDYGKVLMRTCASHRARGKLAKSA